MIADRRSFIRYQLDFPIAVLIDDENENGKKDDKKLNKYEARSVNISRTSIEISCDNTLVDILLSQKKYPRTCRLNFQVPDFPHDFAVDTVIATHRRLSQQQYYVVMLFSEFSSEKGDLLGEYLSQISTEIYHSKKVKT